MCTKVIKQLRVYIHFVLTIMGLYFMQNRFFFKTYYKEGIIYYLFNILLLCLKFIVQTDIRFLLCLNKKQFSFLCEEEKLLSLNGKLWHCSFNSITAQWLHWSLICFYKESTKEFSKMQLQIDILWKFPITAFKIYS